MKGLYSFSLLGIIALLLLAVGCTDEGELPPNPFDPYANPDSAGTNTTPVNLDPQSFAGLHHYIFRPTCANSGCHDGTFEPDFRSIESSYNTLVYHPLIKNDPQGSFTYRVVPGNPNASVLMTRLEVDIDGQSGIMPLALEPTSDWSVNRAQYIANIRAWIQNGARDIFGNAPSQGNIPPAMKGVVAFANGSSTPLERDTDNGAIILPGAVSSLEIWFSIEDDATASSALQYNKVKFASTLNEFGGVSEQNLQVAGTPITQMGYFNQTVQYTHRITIDPSNFPGQQIFFRIYVQDGQSNSPTEIPSDGGADYIKEYFSFKRQ